MLMEQQTVTNPAIICGLNQQSILAQARPLMINHLTNIVVDWVWLAGLLNM